jgi:DNA-directed RNA polymerase specialized sigma subunit
MMDEGKSQIEIAQALGVSQATISRDQHRLVLYFIVGRKKAQRMTE